MSIKNDLAMLYHGVRYIFKNVQILKKGQATNYSILQFSHRLEKGLCIRNPRHGWGYDKANNLIDLIIIEKKSSNPDLMAIKIAEAVLVAFIEEKKNSNESDMAAELEKKMIAANINMVTSNDYGGALVLKKEAVLLDESFEKNVYYSP